MKRKYNIANKSLAALDIFLTTGVNAIGKMKMHTNLANNLAGAAFVGLCMSGSGASAQIVYFAGSQADAAALRAKALPIVEVNASDVDKLDPNQPSAILIVGDTVTVDPAVLKKAVKSGHAVIAMGNTAAVRKSLDAPGQPSSKSGDDIGDDSVIVGAEKVFAKMNVGRVESVFHADNSDPGEAVLAALKWAKDNKTKAQDNPAKVSAQGAIWSEIYRRTGTINTISSGKLNINTSYSKLIPSPDGLYDYYAVKLEAQSVPLNGQKTSLIGVSITPVFGKDSDKRYQLQGYGPTTTTGSATASVNIGITCSSSSCTGGFNKTWTFTTPDVTVSDLGQYDFGIASWRHTIASNSLAASNTYLVQPGATIRVPLNTTNPWADWYETYTVRFTSGQWSYVAYTNAGVPGHEHHIENLWSRDVGTPRSMNIKGGDLMGQNVVLYNYSGQGNEIWKFQPSVINPGYFKIKSRAGWCAAEVYSSAQPWKHISSDTCGDYGDPWQTFFITYDYGGWSHIRNKSSGLCMGTQGGTSQLSMVNSVACANGGDQHDQLWGMFPP